MKKKLPIDIWLAGAFFTLIVIGIIMVYSSSAFYAEEYFGDHLYFLKRHLTYLFLGLIGMGLAYSFPIRKLQGYTWLPVAISGGILFYLAFIVQGRWVSLGPIGFQGVDVARFFLILFFADSLSRKEKMMTNFTEGLFPHLCYLIVFSAMVLKQPDFSSSFLLALTLLTMLFVAPVKLPHLALTGASFIPLLILAVIFSPYKLQRVLTFMNPEADLQGAGYQIYQSMVSFGSGGITGVGYARSTQKMFFLPEAHTDFVFAIIGEELGLLGTMFVVALFGLVLVRGIRAARRADEPFIYYLTIGITAHFVLYAIVNMMVTLHLLPATGLPLPFISYGGTALLFSCIYAGILMKIANETVSGKAPRRKPSRSNRGGGNNQSFISFNPEKGKRIWM